MKNILFLLGICIWSTHAQTFPVYVVLFTHIEDNTPIGMLGSQQSKDNYTLVRNRLIEMANLAHVNNVSWSLQPDWKILLAALMYEDSLMKSPTKGKNFLRYLKEDLGAAIDAHSHESYGYNYTDVANLLDSLGVGGSTVIGGHIWDPTLPQFAYWDRFRVPVYGQQYPWAVWRGNILMGSGTPNHVNDPVISGVWRPKDRYHYFVDDTAGNIICIGQYKSDIAGIGELIALYANGIIPGEAMLTSSYHIKPADITAAGGIALIDSTVIKPLSVLRRQNKIRLTDFTSLVLDWKTLYGSRATLYDPGNATAVRDGDSAPESFAVFQNFPNPFNPSTSICYRLPERCFVSLRVFDLLGRDVASLVTAEQDGGMHQVLFSGEGPAFPSGIYWYQLRAGNHSITKCMTLLK
ncbi:MAG: T9SS type A sorting domain-containing protein [Ignavibacteriales bacterium]|nr:T9SS type A sorting domain-containing protein [Ignavibacteriales bacterium]